MSSKSAFVAWRKKQGITQASLAKKLKQSRTSISLKERNLAPWQQHDLRVLHDTYGLSSDFVLGLGDEAERVDTRLGVA